MRLSKIKLAGFKSFVEPTTIHMPGNLVGIVGPNGCGKSNVIDAVRWVMGESSAKHLRGDSMDDVIFSGSSTRKPVGAATIELFFDNSDGSIAGPYASYAEISVKRTVTRDGHSAYFLNNTRCRRKDITSLFLGTGLGPRSYAIIEQGMISRLIEARPEDMRTYLEEAAGISKYKARRKETENRIKHTRENLERLDDLRDEVEKQIKHLQRQAKTAERYKTYKQDERRLEAELLAVRLQDLDSDLNGESRGLARHENALEAAIAAQRAVESQIESSREAQIEASDAFNEAQGQHYAVQGEIARLEQSIDHAKELRKRQQHDLAQAEEQLAEIATEIAKDREELEQLDLRLERLTPDLQTARESESQASESLAQAESVLSSWQDSWQQFTLEANEVQQTCHVERSRIEHLDTQLSRLVRQRDTLNAEQDEISLSALEERLADDLKKDAHTRERVQQLDSRLEELHGKLEVLREQDRRVSGHLEEVRQDLEARRGRLMTIEALQEAALGRDKTATNAWLDKAGLEDNERLAQRLRVHDDWTLAAETVLGPFLQAVCVPGSKPHLENLPASADLTLLENELPAGYEDSAPEGSLLAFVERAGSAAPILAAVRVADSLEAAFEQLDTLSPGGSVVTRDGVWLGPGWARVKRAKESEEGVIAREQDIRQLQEEIRDFEQRVARLDKARRDTRHQLEQLEHNRSKVQAGVGESHQANADAAAALAATRQEVERSQQRLANIRQESTTIRDEIESVEQFLRKGRAKLEQGVGEMARNEEQRDALQGQKAELHAELERARDAAHQERANVQQIAIEFESRRSSRDSANTTLSRISAQREALALRVETIGRQLIDGESPLEGSESELAAQLARKIDADKALGERQRALETADGSLRANEGRRMECEQAVSECRELVDAERMRVRELEVRREGIAEQFQTTGQNLAEITQALPEDADAESWADKLERMRRKIDRLGPINLAAINEFEEQTERKNYLDEQHQDLVTALETLEKAIRKIDRETRTRFRETFDKVNAGMKRIFPRLFGGGHAYLSLEGDDVLSAGVTVMAQPPGKRNSHIHLLSGGEKALTAVALVFSIFELNPAPFCLLDEVDAPLDDNNVSRFCEIVKEMSSRVQFMFITHNKVTMEMASQLTGVTMNEPGVSRLVTVDIDSAVKLAAS
jgi:chromosome segregation protein